MAAGLLVFLFILPSRPARAAAARVEIAPLSGAIPAAPAPLSYFASMPAMAPGLTAAPSLAAPLAAPAAPAAAQAAAAVPAEALSAPAEAVSSGVRAAASPPGTAREDRASSVSRKMDKIAAALQNEAGRASPDLLARDYAVYERADLQRVAGAVIAGTTSKYRREVASAVFSPNHDLREKLIARHVEENRPGAWSVLLREIYFSLREAYFLDEEPGVRAAVSSRLHDSAALFLDIIAGDPRVPDAARDLARGIAARYLTEDRLLSVIAWGRREKNRIADGRRELAAEAAALPVLAKKLKRPDVATRSEDRDWRAPSPDAAVPAKAGTGVQRWTTDLNKESLEFKDAHARFQLSRGRWNASRKLHLSARRAALEKKRWTLAASAFEAALLDHEHLADYTSNATLKQNFSHIDGGNRGRMIHPPHPSLVLLETGEGYVLQAVFETKIDNPAVIAAFRRSIEGFWTRPFEENGRRRRFTTQTAVRVLGPGEGYTPGALRLVDGGIQSSSSDGVIKLRREFGFHVPAHEFGHIMGLPDEYVGRYSPETMTVFTEQDRSSVMANIEGLPQSRHFVRVLEAMREAGRLKRLTPE